MFSIESGDNVLDNFEPKNIENVRDIQEHERLGILPRRRKKVSVCSNFSTFSNSSEQPYISMMSNASRERKISTLSTGSLAIGRYSSEESVRARKTSEGIPSSLPKSCQTELSQAVACEDTEDLSDQPWLRQNQLYGRKKKISLRKISGKDNMRRRVEIFPGYEKAIRERANNPGEKLNVTAEQEQETETQGEDCEDMKHLQEGDPDNSNDTRGNLAENGK